MLPALLLGLVLALAGTPAVTPPPGGVDVDYQLGGAIPSAPNVGIVVRDRRAAPEPGRYNICYVNGFQTQPGAQRLWRRHRALVLHDDGRPVIDQAWGERLLDIRTAAKRERLALIVGRWIDRCAHDGYDAVEIDNLDSFSRSHGLLRPRHAKRYARLLTARAHAAGLAIGQKNWAGLDGRTLGFDFAVAEECGRYDECGRYVASYGDRVLVVEYRPRDFRRTCAAYGARLGVVLRDRDLAPDGRRAWC
jgi:hypothetical protein